MKHGWILLTTEMVVSVWDLINAALDIEQELNPKHVIWNRHAYEIRCPLFKVEW